MAAVTPDDEPPLAAMSTRDAPHLEADEAATMPLLLHSVGLFHELLSRLISAVGPTGIAEIGGEGGLLTRELLRQADALDAALLCVDPAPGAALVGLAEATRLELVRAVSPAALEQLPPCEVVVLDGDHNYATVRTETTALLDRAIAAGGHTLLIYHDVAWPWARRDLYYDPSALDPGDRHQHRFDTGVSVFSHDPLPGGGMRSRGSYAVAEEAGGEANGVLTGIEDAIAGRDGLILRIVPAIFGLGILYPEDAPWAADVDRLLEPLDRSPLLARLERNRLALYAKLLELQDENAALARAYDADRATFEARYAETSGENLALRERLAALSDRAPTAGGSTP